MYKKKTILLLEPFKEAKNAAHYKCVWILVYAIKGNSQLAIYPQTKALGRLEAKLESFLKLSRRTQAETQIAFLFSSAHT